MSDQQLAPILHRNDELDAPHTPRERRVLTDSASVRGLVSHALPWIVAFGLLRVVALGIAVHPPHAGETAFVRWLRVLPDHPVRTTIAIGLLIFALRAVRTASPTQAP